METQTPKFENPRHAMLAELSKAHDERVAAESVPVEGMQPAEFEPAPKAEPIKAEGSATPPEPVKAQEIDGAGSPEPKAEEQPRAEDGKFAEKAKEPEQQIEMVTVKIDGETMQVPKSEVDAVGSINLYQIEKTSAKRLQQMNAAKAELAAFLQQQRQQQQPQPQPQPQTPKPNQAEIMKELRNQIAFGDDEQGAAALSRVIEQATTPVQNIDARITQHLQVQRITDAEARFVDNIKDVLYGPDGNARLSVIDAAKARVDRMHLEIARSGQFPANPDEFFKNLEVEIRKDFGKPAVTSDLSKRTEKKAEIAEPKTAAGRVPAPSEKKPLTVQEQIDQVRKARGKVALYH